MKILSIEDSISSKKLYDEVSLTCERTD
jgi:hypothetical protein